LRIYPTGGWTSDWQGVSAADEDKWFSYGSSLLGAFMAKKLWDVSFCCGVDILGQSCDEVDDQESKRFVDSTVDEVNQLVEDQGQDLKQEGSIARAAKVNNSWGLDQWWWNHHGHTQ